MRSWLMGGLLVLLGVLVVALLMTFRVDVEAAARSGPRWRRKLVGAGLAVLAAIGVLWTTDHAKAKGAVVTCYVIARVDDHIDIRGLVNYDRITSRLRQLERMAASDRLDPVVTTKVLDTIEAEVKAFSEWSTFTVEVLPELRDQAANATTKPDKADLSKKPTTQAEDPDQARNAELSAKVTAQIGQIRAKLAAASQPAEAGSQQVTDRDLAATAEWKRLTTTWTEAAAIAAGKKGPYPFDRQGKKRILDALDGIPSDIETLRRGRTLSDAEADLLGKERATLRLEVAFMRTTEDPVASCYLPVAPWMPADLNKRLAERLPALERVASSDRLHPGVIVRVLDTIEADIDVLTKSELRMLFSEADRAKATEQSERAKNHLERIRIRLAAAQGGDRLEDSPGWKSILAAWTTAELLADMGSTAAVRDEADRMLNEARLKAKELAAAGLLFKVEAELLCAGADWLQDQIHATMPTDESMPRYEQYRRLPAEESLERLNKRLPLLKQLAADGTLHSAAVRKILPAIEADLKTLSNTEEMEQLDAQTKDQANKTRTAVEQAVASLKKTMAMEK